MPFFSGSNDLTFTVLQCTASDMLTKPLLNKYAFWVNHEVKRWHQKKGKKERKRGHKIIMQAPILVSSGLFFCFVLFSGGVGVTFHKQKPWKWQLIYSKHSDPERPHQPCKKYYLLSSCFQESKQAYNVKFWHEKNATFPFYLLTGKPWSPAKTTYLHKNLNTHYHSAKFKRSQLQSISQNANTDILRRPPRRTYNDTQTISFFFSFFFFFGGGGGSGDSPKKHKHRSSTSHFSPFKCCSVAWKKGN